MRVPAHAKLEGTNPNIIPCVFAGKDSVYHSTIGSNDFALVRFTRLNTASDAANITQCRATISIQLTYFSADAATFATVEREIAVQVMARGSTLTVGAVTLHNLDTGIGANATLTGLTESPASALLTMQIPGMVPAGAILLRASWSIIWNQISSLDGNTFAVELQ